MNFTNRNDGSSQSSLDSGHAAARVIGSCGILFLSWLLVSAAVHYIGVFSGDAIPGAVALVLSLCFFTVVASSLTAGFVIVARKYGGELAKQRPKLVFLNVLVFAALFLISKASGEASPMIFIISTANLLVFATLLGTWLVEPIRRPTELVVVCIIVSFADIFSVTGGPTRGMAHEVAKYYAGDMKGAAPFADFLLFKYPVPGEAIPLPIFGVADWIIIAFLASAALRLNINDSLVGPGIVALSKMHSLSIYLPVTVLGLGLAMFAASVFNTFLPALPFIAFFFVLYILIRYPDARRLTRTDWMQIVVFSSILIGLTGARLMGAL